MPYNDFLKRFKLLLDKRKDLIINTLSNIFTMRLIGNKTHGDLAEIGIAEFINQFMYDFKSEHVGKDLFRAKGHEEDIVVINELTQTKIPISLKAYGDGPLQLSTDKDTLIFSKLSKYGEIITSQKIIDEILKSSEFNALRSVNIMPLIYREKQKECNIMVFDFEKMCQNTAQILLIDRGYKYDFASGNIIQSKGRKHPIYIFIDKNGSYICEVRYGDATANALQRGFWTHTINASAYFNTLTGWISYEHNHTLIKLFRLALNSSPKGHEKANLILQDDINNLRQG